MLGLRARDVLTSEVRFQAHHGSSLAKGWLWFRHWRRTRPFWAGLSVALAGLEILSIPLAPLAVVIHEGVAGVSGELFGALLIVAGGFLWFAPRQRHFMGVLSILLSLTSFITSNFGGFFIGMLLGLVGGSLALAWAPLRAWGYDGTDGQKPQQDESDGLDVSVPQQLQPEDSSANGRHRLRRRTV